ncbi:MAG: hypothetical protein NC342_09190 [Pseudoflavonifractor sp.]|nr:hypothetical protein [Alloprevotella sp.]MCM1117694.1 hypothetical protein [Pseudoflavonifractor sp.]
MTIAQAISLHDIAAAIPLQGLAPATAVKILLLHADLAAILRDAETRRADILTKAREGADLPSDFDARLAGHVADPDADPDFAPILARLDAIFTPAWKQVTESEAEIKRPFLDEADLANLAEASAAWAATITLRDKEATPTQLLHLIALHLLCRP